MEPSPAAARLAPDSAVLASCDTIQALVREELRFTPSRKDGLWEVAGWNEQHTGCEISGQGTYAPIEPGMLPITTLVRALEARGWGDSPRYESEGDYSVAWSLARAGVLCVLRETSLVEDETDEADTMPVTLPPEQNRYELRVGCMRESAGRT